MMKTLEKRNFPVGKLTLLASAKSAGKRLPFKGGEVVIEELTENLPALTTTLPASLLAQLYALRVDEEKLINPGLWGI